MNRPAPHLEAPTFRLKPSLPSEPQAPLEAERWWCDTQAGATRGVQSRSMLHQDSPSPDSKYRHRSPWAGVTLAYEALSKRRPCDPEQRFLDPARVRNRPLEQLCALELRGRFPPPPQIEFGLQYDVGFRGSGREQPLPSGGWGLRSERRRER